MIESRRDLTRIIKTRRACIYTAMNLDETSFESRRVLCYNTKAFTQSRRAMYDDYDFDYTYTNDYADLEDYYVRDTQDLDEDYARDGHDYQDLAYRHYA